MILPYGLWLIWAFFIVSCFNTGFCFGKGIVKDDLDERIVNLVLSAIYFVVAYLLWIWVLA